MNSTVEELDDNRVKVSVDVAEEELEGAIDAAFRKIAKEVRLPGFRPGKVPRKVLEARFGADFARGEALRDAIPEFYVQAVREHEVDVIAPPEFEVTAGEEAGPVSFDAVVETRPLITITGYDALTVEIPSPLVGDDEVSDQLDTLRGQFGELASVDRSAIEGDHVTIDIAGTHDGEDVPGLTADDYVYEVGSGAVVAEIDEHLTGTKVGDIIEFDAEHPDPDTEGALSFRILVKDVQEKVLPDLDDAFAVQASEFETVDELRNDIIERLSEGKRQQALAMASDGTATELAALVDLEPPAALIDSEVQQRLQDLVMRLRQQGIDIEQYFEMTGQSPEQLQQSLREPAAKAVLVDLALRHIVVGEELEATDDDIDAEFENLATQLGSDVEAVRDQFETVGTMFELRADIAKRKAMEWLTDRVTLMDEDGNTIDRSLLEAPEVDTDEGDDEIDEASAVESGQDVAIGDDDAVDDGAAASTNPEDTDTEEDTP
ncbi:MAG: trigger factor [Acidimicrobiia bacterium]|nr:trigger factor [Acidimicrobiia bacterium]